MKLYNIAILGATGAVGREMLNALEEFDVPVGELRLLASKRSVGKKLMFRGKEIEVAEATNESFTGMDFVLGAVENPKAIEFSKAIVDAGAVFIDNSSAFRLNDDVPLIIPEINGADALNNHGIISNPNCSTIISILAIAGIAKLSPVETMIASTYQAVSGAGQGGQVELEQQLLTAYGNQATVQSDSESTGQTNSSSASQSDSESIGQTDSLDLVASSAEKSSFLPNLESKVFPTQIAFNVIPMIGSEKENGYTSEEMKMQNEGRKILHLPNLKVSCTCVRVPVMRSHSISITLRTKDKISVEEAKQAIAAYPGCVLIDNLDNCSNLNGQTSDSCLYRQIKDSDINGNQTAVMSLNGRSYPTPLDTSNQNLVYVGRIREDLTSDNGLTLWCCGDQVRKGAATNAVQILCYCINQDK